LKGAGPNNFRLAIHCPSKGRGGVAVHVGPRGGRKEKELNNVISEPLRERKKRMGLPGPRTDFHPSAGIAGGGLSLVVTPHERKRG